MTAAHDTVLLHEAVDALVGNPAGLYVDGTFGRGGHSREILRRLNAGGRSAGLRQGRGGGARGAGARRRRPTLSFSSRLLRRPARTAGARGLASPTAFSSISVCPARSSTTPSAASASARRPPGYAHGPPPRRVGGRLAGRGEGRGDCQVLRDYGEERYARRIAAAIVRERGRAPLTRTAQLAAWSARPIRAGKSTSTRRHAFQAIRIRINRELDDLRPAAGRGPAAAGSRRSPGGDQFSLAGGPHGQALPARR
jgi:16S rRNA (cytosine1402-N4)-methyltransferase